MHRRKGKDQACIFMTPCTQKHLKGQLKWYGVVHTHNTKGLRENEHKLKLKQYLANQASTYELYTFYR